MTSITTDELEQQSKIYGRNMNLDRQLNNYELQVNAASLSLCKDNISLLSDRKKLFELAKQKVDADGYNYKKKRSRSKAFGTKMQNAESGETEKKKNKTVKEVRDNRIFALREDIASSKETIKLLEQQRNKFVTSENFLQAAEIVDQVKNKRKDIRELELELGKLQKAEARSTKYHKNKIVQKKSSSVQQKLDFQSTQPSISNYCTQQDPNISTDCTQQDPNISNDCTQQDPNISTDCTPQDPNITTDCTQQDPNLNKAKNVESTQPSISTDCTQQGDNNSNDSLMQEDENFC